MVQDLVETGVNKSRELDLGDGFETLRRHADRHARDQSLRQRGIHHPHLAETLLQTEGGAEHAPVDAYIFAQDDDVRVRLQLIGERQIDCFNECKLRHGTSSEPDRLPLHAIGARQGRV